MSISPSAAAAALVVCLISIATAGAQAQALPERIIKSKVIKVAVSTTYPPMEIKNVETGQLQGFDIDLGAAMARQMGVTFEWVESSFEQLLPSLATGRADMILSGLTDRPARRETLDFVNYMNSGSQFYLLAGTRDVAKAADLCGKTVGAMRSTAYPAEIKRWSEANCEASGKPAVVVEGVSDNQSARSQLKQGRIVASVQGSETVPYVMSQEPDVYKSIGEPFGGVQHGMAVTKADTQLRDALAAALKQLIADGTYAGIVAKWSLQASAVKQAAINGAPLP
ncbi:MAG: transporter substrate-binding protein [Rhizobacter sp.]|nr:transporter substrate-binding protein [Rhizobacter sp.]